MAMILVNFRLHLFLQDVRQEQLESWLGTIRADDLTVQNTTPLNQPVPLPEERQSQLR